MSSLKAMRVICPTSLPSSSTALPRTTQPSRAPRRQSVVVTAATETSENVSSSRRETLLMAALSGLAALSWASPSEAANTAVTGGLKNYVKKKKLDRIELYVPPLLNARDQLVRVGRVMLQDPKAARELLRSGAFKGLRQSVRALGEYAADHGATAAVGTALVTAFFKELEGLDYEMFIAVRDSKPLRGDVAKQRLDGTISNLDKLLEKVPKEAMDAAMVVVETLKKFDEESVSELEGGEDSEEVKKLQKLL